MSCVIVHLRLCSSNFKIKLKVWFKDVWCGLHRGVQFLLSCIVGCIFSHPGGDPTNLMPAQRGVH